MMQLFSHKIQHISAIYFGLALSVLLISGSYVTASISSQLTYGAIIDTALPYFNVQTINFTAPAMSTPYKQALSDQYYTFLHGSAKDEYEGSKQVGVFLTANSVARTDFFTKTLDDLQAAGGTAIVIDVKGTNVYFDAPGAAIAQEIGRVRPLYDLPQIVADARARGIYTIARYIAVKDPTLANSYPETQVYHPETGRSIGSVWVDPANPITLAYNAQILREVAASGIDEINLDYIRYGTEVPNYLVGLNGQQKSERLIKFLQMARTVVDTYGNNTKLGISTYAILGWNFPINFESVGQDINKFAKYVDIISPMAYPSTFAAGAYFNPVVHPKSRNYYLVYRTLQGYKDLLDPEDVSKLRPWIQGYYLYPSGIAHEIEAVYDTGLCGYTVWSAGNVYGRTYTAMNMVDVPVHCR